MKLWKARAVLIYLGTGDSFEEETWFTARDEKEAEELASAWAHGTYEPKGYLVDEVTVEPF